jgi:hypothetical protein
MAQYRIHITDMTYYNMTAAERIKALEEVEKRAKEMQINGTPPDTSNPFPEWVQGLMKELGPAKFDRMNNEYKVNTPASDEDEADEEYAKFKVKMEKVASEDPERQKWRDTHHIQVSITFEDENKMMDELEESLGGKPSRSGGTKRKKASK